MGVWLCRREAESLRVRSGQALALLGMGKSEKKMHRSFASLRMTSRA
jgi:hypothetical protein